MHQNTPKSCLLRQKYHYFFLLSPRDRRVRAVISSRDFTGMSRLTSGEKMSSEAPHRTGSPGYDVMWRGDTGTVGALRTGGLSHSLAVVLWRGHLIVAGTEEGGVLHQVPAEKPEDGCRWDCSKTWLLMAVRLSYSLQLPCKWRLKRSDGKRQKGADLRLVRGETFIWKISQKYVTACKYALRNKVVFCCICCF